MFLRFGYIQVMPYFFQKAENSRFKRSQLAKISYFYVFAESRIGRVHRPAN